MTRTELIDAMAALEHERWSGWEKYRAVASADKHASGEANTDRWFRRRNTAYVHLSETEKESNRAEVRKTLALLDHLGVKLVVEVG